MNYLLSILVLLSLVQTSHAKENRFKVFKENSNERASITNSKPVQIFYEKLSWNQKPNQVEQGFMYLRDQSTGKLLEIVLTETEPNSGIFNMDYDTGGFELKKIALEVYSAPQSMLKDGRRLEIMKELIAAGTLKRKPFLLRILRQKGQLVDIFDNKEKAIAAYNLYRKELGLSPDSKTESIIEVANKDKATRKKIIDTSTLQSMFLANEKSQAATNAKNQELREVMRKLEETRRKEIISRSKKWSAKKTAKNSDKATQLIKRAVKNIKAEQFSKSMKNFLKASDLTPQQEDIYQQYGVSLFRDKKYNQSIVVLDLSRPSDNRIDEKDFYLGVNYFQLKDYKVASRYFKGIVDRKSKAFGPSAAFYLGRALIEINEFEKANEAFQYVLDYSSDTKLDKRAEKFIEYSIDRKRIAEKRANWFFFDGVLGLMYDSNIILAADQAREQGTVQGEGIRFLTQLSPRARPYYTETDEISIRLDFTNLKSFDTDFSSNPDAETADPIIYSINVPWTHRTTLGEKAYFFDLSPAYETIIMDLDGTGNATITESLKLEFNNTLVVSNKLIAKGDCFFSSNDSNILGDESAADSTAGGLRLSGIFILNKDRQQYLIPEFGYQVNNANDGAFAFNRVDLGVSYTQSVFDSFVWNSRFAYFLANYENTRVDNNYSLSTGLSRRLSSHWNWALMGTYTINDSTTNQFNKYNIVSTFSFSY